MNRSSARARVLIGAILIQLILGTVYGYSIFWRPLDARVFPPVVTEMEVQEMEMRGEYLHEMTVVADEATKKRRQTEQQGYLKYAFSICILSFAGTMVLAGRVQDLKGPRFTATIGGVLLGGGFLAAGLLNTFVVFYLAHALFAGMVTLLLLALYHMATRDMNPKTMPLLHDAPRAITVACVVAAVLLGQRYVGRLGELDELFVLWGTVGFLAGAGIGFAYVCPIAALIKWFPKRKGLVSGLAVAGFGFGAYIFSHPQLPFSAENYLRNHDVVSLFTLHGLVCLVAVALGATLLSNPPDTAPARLESAWQDTLRRPAFYILWLMFFSGAMAGLMVIGILKGFAGDQLVGAAGGAAALGDARAKEIFDRGVTAVGWLAVFNALGRIAWGMVSDRVGRTVAFVAMFLVQAAMMFVLGGLDTEVSLAVGASIVGFNFGGNFALFPSATADLFGAKNLGANYGWVFTSYGIAGVVGIMVGNAAKTATGSYAAAFSLAGILCVISAGLAIGMHLQRRRAAAVAV
ncbi:MAG: MFS transporter [Candidatus Krumholzibacteria bacterium]|nr:MFS transporter [Candidatus Krumholzibacteria bacterium]MDH4336544.1 MFS transporter [Candidatus Krumholzibacteria bacterium]MDH5269625.1 MFS transporter [Candidatus Krumholzibacteria bacterium]